MANRTGDATGLDADRSLVLAFQAGEVDAYKAIYRRHETRVRRTCARVLRDPEDVEEATQETFLRAYQALGRFNGQYQLGAWLARIAVNVSIDSLRAKARSPHLVGLPGDDEVRETARGPEELVTGSDPRVSEALDDIQPLHAQALKLRAVAGMSHDEIAGRLAMSPAQVKALLHRARRSFRRAWEKAENWALAPVLGLRSLLDERSNVTQTGGPNLAVSALGGPGFSLFIERVAASAVLVAVALTGMPTQTSAPVPPAVSEGSVAAGSDAGYLPRERAGMAAGDRSIGGSVTSTPPGLTDRVTDTVTALIDQTDGDDPEKKTRGNDEDEEPGPLGGPSASSRKKVERAVQETLEKVQPLP